MISDSHSEPSPPPSAPAAHATYNTPKISRKCSPRSAPGSIEELFDAIPDDLKLGRATRLAAGDVRDGARPALAAACRRQSARGAEGVLSGRRELRPLHSRGVDVIGSRSEFYTSYTPYQAEASQGNLQAMFEYQIAHRPADGHGCGELQPVRRRQRRGRSGADGPARRRLARTKIVVPASVHPEYRQTIATYLENLDAEIVTARIARAA